MCNKGMSKWDIPFVLICASCIVAAQDSAQSLEGYHAAIPPAHLASSKEHKRGYGDDIVAPHKVAARG